MCNINCCDFSDGVHVKLFKHHSFLFLNIFLFCSPTCQQAWYNNACKISQSQNQYMLQHHSLCISSFNYDCIK